MLSYLVAIATSVGLYMLLALALNLQWGLTGMVNFGVAGFYALGAYASGLATERLGVPFSVGFSLAVAIGTLSGAALSSLTLRLSEDFLAIVMLGFAELVRLIATNEDWLTRGPRGLGIATRPLAGVFDREGYTIFYLGLVGLAVLAVFIILERLRRAPIGRVLRAIREDDLVASVLGKDVFAFRRHAFALGGAIMGAAGSLYAHYVQSISPDHFTTAVTMFIWMSVIVGGAGNNFGLLIGAGVVMALLEGSRFLGNVLPGVDAEQLSALRIILVGVLLIAAIRFRPQGILPERRRRGADLLQAADSSVSR